MRYIITQHFEGYIRREIEADSEEEATDKMVSVNQNITLDEMLNCNWDEPFMQGVLDES